MNKTFNWKPFSVLAASLLLAACGGGGGGSSDAAPAAPGGNPATPVSPPPTPSTPATTITGAVTKGPVSGATLQLFEMDAFGNPIGTALATGQSEADGTFTIPLDLITPTSDLLIVASGGAFIDESDQNPDIAQKRQITLGANDTFLSVVPLGSDAVALTPFTTALVLRGRVLGGPDGTFAEKFAAARTAFTTQAGFDVLTTIPANPVAPAADASAAQLQYALLLGGIANLINNVAIQSGAAAPTYDMVVAVTFDLVDGVFDGQYFGQTDVPGSGQTPVTLPQNINFTNEVNRFRNNNAASFDQTLALPTIEVPTLANGLPTANAGVDQSVAQAQAAPVQLDGSLSADPDSGLFFSWVQTAGTTVTLDNGAIVNPSFTAPARLIGNETLTFELTVIDTVGFTSVDTVNVEVVGALSNDFYVVDEDEVGDGVGVDVDGGGRITLIDAIRGELKADIGPAPFSYTVAGNVLTVEFDTPYFQDDFDEDRDPDGDGVLERLLIEEFADRLIFTLVTDNPNGDALTIETQGFELVLPLDDPDATPLATNPINDIDPITAFDVAQATPFANLAGTRRTLMFNSADAVPTLGNPAQQQPPEIVDELFPEIFEFTDAVAGSTVNSGVPFTYTIAADGSLDVVFQNGDTAKYINLGPRITGTGDLMAAEYVLATPFFPDDSPSVTDVTLSIAENPAFVKPTTRAEVAGVYSGTFFDDDIETGANINVKLNPEGSGSVTFDRRANRSQFFDFDNVFAFRSSLGICWDVASNGDIVIDRAFSLNQAFPNSFSSETNDSFCLGVTEESTEFQFVLTPLDSDGTTFKFFNVSSTNRCQFIPTTDCLESPVLDPTGYELRIQTRVPLTANPPVAALDPVLTPDATPITIDLLANDIARDNPIDPGSVQLGRGPFQGTATIDQATGVVTYTPNPGIRSDLIEYTVADTAGNRSQIQITQIDINPCPLVNGIQPFYDVFTRDCIYDGSVIGAGNPVLLDLDLGPLPGGGVHRFQDSLFIGDDFSTDAGLASANGGLGISQGGDGPSLNIAAGTILAFENQNAVLSVRRGSQINVGGTPTEPVTMTSFSDIQSKRAEAQGQPPFQQYNDVGQWGGLEILGFGVTNGCSYSGSVQTADLAVIGECHLTAGIQGGNYGGDNNADSSGAINYLVVKHSGELIGDASVNGVTFASVGSGTSISNLEVYSTAGDGIGIFGGDADFENLAVLYARSFGIAVGSGYSGNVSESLLIQDEFSGRACVDVGGINDIDTLNMAQIDAVIAQGLNSRPTISNMTCVGSIDVEDDFGAGIMFREAAFGTLSDSLVAIPGRVTSDLRSSFCVSIEDRSFQALQDGDLTVSSSIFSCPQPTVGMEQSLLEAAGNQFATLTGTIVNPAPTSGTNNVLLEGSPLIYSVANGSLIVDGSPTTITPIGSFIGAVQDGPADWTLDWTFGLQPGLRQIPVWYETPILAPIDQNSLQGQTVALDASNAVGVAPIVDFQWTQIGGPAVTLSDPNAANPSFSAPIDPSIPLGNFDNVEFELLITDADGASSVNKVKVGVTPALPFNFVSYSVATETQPGFGTGIAGDIFETDGAGNGTALNRLSEQDFSYVDDGTEFTITYSGNGLLISDAILYNRGDDNLDTIPDTISAQFFILSQRIRRLGEGNFEQTSTTRQLNTNLTTSTVLDDNVTEQAFFEVGAVVDLDGLPAVALPDFNNKTFALPAYVATGLPDLLDNNGTDVFPVGADPMTFNADGTGFARYQNQTFTWQSNGDDLSVQFANGDTATYRLLEQTTNGDVVAGRITRSNGDKFGEVSFAVEDVGLDFTALNSPGIYTASTGIEEGPDGSSYETFIYYRLRPDGTGQREGEFAFSFGDNSFLPEPFVFPSSVGICWETNLGEILKSRVRDPAPPNPGVPTPSVSYCSTVTNAERAWIRSFDRLNDLPTGEQVHTLRTEQNQCGFQNVFGTPEVPGCDPNILRTSGSLGLRFMEFTPFTANPPIAVPDTLSAQEGVAATVNVLSNDVAGDNPIDFSTLEIVYGPYNGTATVDVTTGEITYTPDLGASSQAPIFTTPDRIGYQVRGTGGNISNHGALDITVTP